MILFTTVGVNQDLKSESIPKLDPVINNALYIRSYKNGQVKKFKKLIVEQNIPQNELITIKIQSEVFSMPNF